MSAVKIIKSLLKPDASLVELEQLCADAKGLAIETICIPPLFIKKAKAFMADDAVKIAAVIGFPFGYSAVEAKIAEAVLALVEGADEIDLVINTAALKNNDWQYMAQELNAVLPVIRTKEKILKIILETALLTPDEISKCCDLYGIAGVDYLVTGTGYFGETPPEIVHAIRTQLADAVKIIAVANKINDSFAAALFAAGATYIQLTESAVF